MLSGIIISLVLLSTLTSVLSPRKCSDSNWNGWQGKDLFALVTHRPTNSKHQQMVDKVHWYISTQKGLLNTSCVYISLLLVTLSHDVEVNPGPRPPKYPCGCCGRAVKWNDAGIQCDGCETWYHRVYSGMSQNIYDIHCQHESYSWLCLNYGLPYFSTRYFDISTLSSPSSFSVLDDSDPILTFTSIKSKKTETMKNKNYSRKINVMNVNFRSVVNKVGEFKTLIDTEKPDILVGTETWLTPDFKSSEILPEGYTIHREDRSHAGKRSGGVFILVSDKLICSHQPQFTTK